MVDTHIAPPEPTPVARAQARVAAFVAAVSRAIHVVLTGDEAGRLRRPALFLIAAGAFGALHDPIAIIGLIAVCALALTDNQAA